MLSSGMNAALIFQMIATAVIAAVAAAGIVLLIKIERRREATRVGALGGDVPALPLSRTDARRMLRRYLTAVAVIVAAIVCAGLLLH